LVPRVGRRQDSAPCTRGSACISLSGASTATGPDSELGRAAPPASVPPGASVARSFERGRLSAPRRRRDGRPVRCRDARIGQLPPSKGGPRIGRPGVESSRLPASARWIGQAPGPGLPSWAAPSRTSKRGCAVRSGLSHRESRSGTHGRWPVSTPFVQGLGEACAKAQRRPGCIGGFEERVADD
jgi:hypothetical protein